MADLFDTVEKRSAGMARPSFLVEAPAPVVAATVLPSRTDPPTDVATRVEPNGGDSVHLIEQLSASPFTALLGGAGVGKTFALKEWYQSAAVGDLALASTTGIAAVNLGDGTTINALLKFFDTQSLTEAYTAGYLQARLRKMRRAGLRRILLDEVSMMDGNQLTVLVRAIDEVNGSGYDVNEDSDADEAFPPLGLTVCGDFLQLPPVKAPFAFESPEWDRFTVHTLTRIWRQTDVAFIEALRAARRGDGEAAVDVLAPCFAQHTDPQFDGPTLLATNEAVDRYNRLRMDTLDAPAHRVVSTRWGQQRGEWKQIPETLELKEGALVMVLANNYDQEESRYRYVNGDLGEFRGISNRKASVRLQRTGEVEEVSYIQREVTEPLEVGERKLMKAAGEADKIKEKSKVTGAVTYMPLRVAYATTVHKCVSGDTKVLVHKRGAVPIEQVRVGEYIDTGFGPARLVAAQQTWQDAYRLTTERGYTVVCSAEHRWMADNDLLETRRLRKGTQVCLTPETTVEGTHEIDRDVAWWVGACLGDANWSDRREGQIHFANIDEGLRQRWMQIAQRLGGRPNTRRDKRGCHLTSLPVRLRLAAWGCPYVTTLHKRIPHVVWESGQAAWAGCLQGLFDTDGAMKEGRLLFANRSLGLAQDVQLLLLYLGIPSTLGTYEGRTGPYYHLRISAEGRDRFAARVGFSHRAKHRALEAWKPNRMLKPYDGTDRVKQIEQLKFAMPMFDVELNAIHRLGFGPFNGSNSQGLSLDKVQINLREGFMGTGGMLYVSLSRARSLAGLRVIGSPATFIARCVTDKRVAAWI